MTSAILIGGAATAGPQDAAILVLNPNSSCALNFNSAATLNVTGGRVHVNTTDPCAVCMASTPTLNVGDLFVAGDACLGTGILNGVLHSGAVVRVDLLAALPAPPNGPTQNSPPSSADLTIQPGYYPGGVHRTSGRLTLSPGIYVVDSASGFTVSGGASVIGNDVMIYMKSGAIDFSGGGTFILSPPTSGTYEGVTIFQARTNPANSSIRGGNALSSITGTLYFPNNLVTLHGGGSALGNQIIASQITIGGLSVINVAYNGAFPGPECPADIAGNDFMVDINDLVAVITAWGQTKNAADVDGNGIVDIDDLVQVITHWGPCP